MRKSELIDEISLKTGVPRVDVLITLEAFVKEVKACLERGEHVYMRGFGSFHPKKRARKVGRNIKRNVSVVIPEHYIPAFKPAKTFIERVRNSREVRDRLAV